VILAQILAQFAVLASHYLAKLLRTRQTYTLGNHYERLDRSQVASTTLALQTSDFESVERCIEDFFAEK
jgi:hypothetical protein